VNTATKIIVASLAVAGGIVTKIALTPATPPTKTVTITAVYPESKLYVVSGYVFTWSYRTNLTDKWKVYTNNAGTNILIVPRYEFQNCAFTVTKISDRSDPTAFITRTN